MPRPSFSTGAALLCRTGSQPHRLSHAPQNRPHITDQPTTRPTSPAMCQPPLTHNRAKRPTTPQCVSHHSHIAAQRIFPNDNNRRKQPHPQPHHQTGTPPTPLCASRHWHITNQTATHPAMCQPPLTHSHQNHHPKHHSPIAARTAMCQPPLTHSRAASKLNRHLEADKFQQHRHVDGS